MGEIPDQGALQGQDARAQIVSLVKMLAAGRVDELTREIETNHQAVFLNFFFWEQHHLAAEVIGLEECTRVLDVLRQRWAQGSWGVLPLGVVATGEDR